MAEMKNRMDKVVVMSERAAQNFTRVFTDCELRLMLPMGHRSLWRLIRHPKPIPIHWA